MHYTVIVHIGFLMNNELNTRSLLFFRLNILFFFYPNVYNTGHLLIIFSQICS